MVSKPLSFCKSLAVALLSDLRLKLRAASSPTRQALPGLVGLGGW